MFTGIWFEGKHSYKDLGLTISERKIGYPSKIKIQERVPYSNIVYDFSNIYGGQEYEPRPLSYTFNVAYKDKAINYYLYETEISNWLMSPNSKVVLKDDLIPGYYFLAEIVNNPSSDFKFVGGSLSVEFTAYPFKIKELEEGNDIWDEFNFLLDYAQTTQYNVQDSIDVTLYNPGAIPLSPLISSTSSMQIIKNGITYNIPVGESTSYDFILDIGENKLRIIGNGSISFHFRLELI